ncbi:hypothetical protein BDR26DRAFT_932542 [Obelidium mucronatum]|nr:hypothetical protein BDR26DRAFT_932542 [Obelidium mucronatum]
MPPLTAIILASTVIDVAVIAAIAGLIVATHDGRSFTSSRQQPISTRTSQWRIVKNNPRYEEVWYELPVLLETVKLIEPAIYDSLFPIERPFNSEGWYCCHFFPAFSVQIVMDHTSPICLYDILPGSNMNSMSKFGQTIHKKRPTNGHIVADSGYVFSSML